jgi:general secretion pathway protein A
VSALAQLWNGEFATLWRAPAAYRGPLMAGQSGEGVSVLAQQLARAASEPVPEPAPRALFDARLKGQVAAFQMAQGLKPDGVAGPTTFMQLSSVLGADEPRLQTELANVAAPPK